MKKLERNNSSPVGSLNKKYLLYFYLVPTHQNKHPTVKDLPAHQPIIHSVSSGRKSIHAHYVCDFIKNNLEGCKH